MKQHVTTLALSLAMASAITPAYAASVRTAAQALPKLKIEQAAATRNGQFITVTLDLGLTDLDLNRNRAVILTPALVNGTDTVRLQPVGIYGNTRYVQQERIGRPLGGPDAAMLRSGSRLTRDLYRYYANTPYTPALEGAGLVILAECHGCCNRVYDYASTGALAELHTPAPEPYTVTDPEWFLPDMLALEQREKNTKSRALTGSAYIDFPVNQTVIYPDYRGNAGELANIRKTLDVVFTDPDVTVKGIDIKGFASPDGPYANNVRLAKGRTEALRDYVSGIYKLPLAVFTTSYEAEDWNGLRTDVAGMDIANKAGILAVIDSDLAPDAKDAALRSKFPEQYAYLLKNVYPALRHSDYRIDYLVRDYQEAAVIEAVMGKDATKLSPEEFYIAAQSHEPGSPEFVGIYALMLQYYPDDPVANYNLALAALMQGDADAAEARLAKAPHSPGADWLRDRIAELREHNSKLEIRN